MFAVTSIPFFRYRLGVMSRCIAAVFGGYALSAAVAASLGLVLVATGSSRVDAAMAGTMFAFVAHAVAALWCFGCATTLRAWLGIGLPTVALFALAAALGWAPGWSAA